jgi:hypothetical protein
MPNLFKALPRKRSTIALAAALATSPALAAQDYPPGLFENSPAVPSGTPDVTTASQPPDVPILSDRRTQSTRWTIIAMGSPPALFAVCRRSSGRTRVAITFIAPRRCRRPPRTSQMSDGLGAGREPARTGRAGKTTWRHFSYVGLLLRMAMPARSSASAILDWRPTADRYLCIRLCFSDA